jgi:hypothetical protein
MVKVLMSGPVHSEVEFSLLAARVKQLQASAAGPFNLLFLLGMPGSCAGIDLGIPVCAYVSGEVTGVNEHLTIMSACGIFTLQHLTVAYCFDKDISPQDSAYASLISATKATGYRGCDVFLTDQWPFDIHQFLSSADYDAFVSLGTGLGNGSRTYSSLACTLCPRYHVSAGPVFYSRAPYLNGSGSPDTRFIGLAAVTTSKEKALKWMHALSLEPLTHMSASDVMSMNQSNVGSATENPFMDTSLRSTSLGQGRRMDYKTDTHTHKKGRFDALVGEAKLKPLTPFFHDITSDQSSSLHILSGPGGDPLGSSRTLFVGGIPPRISDADIKSIFDGAGYASVSKQEGKSFCFVSFETGAAAQHVISNANDFTFRGRQLNINWAKDKTDMPPPVDHVAPSKDHKIVFFGGVPHVATIDDVLGELDIIIHEKDVVESRRPEGKSFMFVEFASYNLAAKVIEMCAAKKGGYHVFGRPVQVGWGRGREGSGAEPSECWFCLSSSTIKVYPLHHIYCYRMHHHIIIISSSLGSLYADASDCECRR